VIDPAANVTKQPVTPAEEAYVNMVMSQTNSAYEALKDDLLTKQDGVRRDVKDFFSLPIFHSKLAQEFDVVGFGHSLINVRRRGFGTDYFLV